MKYFIDSIEHEIDKHKQENQINLIKLEGIENPIIYKEVCKYFKSRIPDFEAKLSKEKYEEFISTKKDDWNDAIEYLKINDFIDFKGAMTSWRNGIVEKQEENKTQLVLLMGTELVQDKGGLADFYTINTETIVKGLGKEKYYSYLKENIKDSGVSIKDEKDVELAINRIFSAIFSIFPIDLIKVSEISEKIEKENFKIMDDIIEFIFDIMPDYWELPIMNESVIPKFTKLKSKSDRAAEVIIKSSNFINRKDFKTKYPTKKKIENIRESLKEYKLENNIDDNEMFPRDTNIFGNFEEFSDCLIDFVKGINFEQNKSKLLKVDFGIVSQILKIKTKSKGEKIGKENAKKIIGNPLEVYLEMILTSINEFKNENDEYPNEVEIKIEEIILGNCIDNDDLITEFNRISAYLGGIVKFINYEYIEIKDEQIKIKYFENNDPFSNVKLNVINEKECEIQELKNIKIFRAKNINVASRIKFNISSIKKDRFAEYSLENINEDEMVDLKDTSEWEWSFKPVSGWKTQFLLLENLRKTDEEFESDIDIPLGWNISNLKQIIGFENEEEFLNKLLEAKIEISTKEIESKLKNINNIDVKIKFLQKSFYEMTEEIFTYGFFGSISKSDSKVNKFISKYEELLNYIRENYNSLRSSEKERIYILANLFNIGKDLNDGIENRYFEYAIMPPVHPIMLEKIVAQKIFIRKSFKDVLVSTIEKKVTENMLKNKIRKMMQLSEITIGADALIGKYNLMTTESVFGNYAFYHSPEYRSDEILNSYVDSIIEDDDEFDIGEMLHSTPKSLIISENIIDYLKVFPTRVDGIKITMLNPESLQYIVAGINDVVRNFEKEDINIKLSIVRDKDQKSGVDYLKYWLDNKLSEKENVSIKTFVINKDFSNGNLLKELEKTLKQQDIIFISNILETRKIDINEDLSSIEEFSLDRSKYPMVFPPLPLSKSATQRAISITQRQFDLSYAHTQLINMLENPNSKEGNYKLIKNVSIDRNKREMIRNIHDNAKWVVCMDESIDKEILSDESNGNIVGFTTGKGNYGELNVTVSARNDVLEDIKAKLKRRLKQHFNSWKEDDKTLEEVAEFCIKKAEELDGGKILKALNSSDYAIHSFLSYIITLQYLNIPNDDENYLIRVLLNLDSHMHWFEELVINENDEDNMRPDLLLLEVKKDDYVDEYGNLKINATVIECKMGNSDNEKRTKAIEQVIKGIKLLNKIWKKDIETSKRYWSNQLYRALIFSRINIDEDNILYEKILNKIEGVLEDKYDITWHGKVFAYWINSEEIDFNEEIIEDISEVEDISSDIKLIECGQVKIKRMILPESEREKEQIFDVEVEEPFEDIEILELVSDEGEIIEDDNLNKDIIEPKEMPEEILSNDNEIAIPSDDDNNSLGTKKELNSVRVLIGEDKRNKKKIYWEYGNKGLNNRHLFISGRSGSGKTYCMQCLLYELTRQGVPAIIFDYTDGFREDKLDPIFRESIGDKLKQQIVRFQKFNINPFERQTITVSGYTAPEENSDIANRIAETFKSVYSLGDQQFSNIYQAVKSGLDKYDEKMDFDKLGEELELLGTKEAKTTLNKIRVFLDAKAFDTISNFSWENIINSDGDVFIIQLTGYTREIQTLLTTLILWDIWNYAKTFGNEETPFVVVLDEAQNLDHGDKSPSGYILTEGRKFGVSGWYATQFLKGQMNTDEIGRLQQAAQKIYFAPPENEVKDIAKIIDSDTKEAKLWEEKLKVLGKGECVTSGEMKRRNDEILVRYPSTIIKVNSLEERQDGNN